VAKSNGRAVAPQRASSRRAEWRAVVEECRRSGLSQMAFCRQRGIPPGTFSCWKHKLTRGRALGRGEAPADAARPPFLPVRVTIPAPASGGAAPGGGGEIEIMLSGSRLVRVRGGVDVSWLGQVLELLEGRRC